MHIGMNDFLYRAALDSFAQFCHHVQEPGTLLSWDQHSFELVGWCRIRTNIAYILQPVQQGTHCRIRVVDW